MLRVLIIHPALTPYRVDLFNEMSLYCRLKVIFLRNNLLSQQFDQRKLRSRLFADHKYHTNGFTLRTQIFRFGIGNEINVFKPDIVITHEFSPVTLFTIIHRRISKKYFSHVIWSADNSIMVTSGICVRKWLKRLTLPMIDGLVLYTAEVANLYRSTFNFKKPIGLIPNIQKESSFRTALLSSESEALSAVRINGLNGKRVLLFVGRLSGRKRVDRLVNAFAGISSQVKDAVLVIIGSGNKMQELKKLVKDLAIENRSIFTGHQEGSSLAAWYRIGGVFALTSEFEPFGAVVNEALLAGLPVVCSEKAGAKNLIKDGINGSVVDPENHFTLQASLLHWLDKCPPISPEQMSTIRQSLMLTQFQDVVCAYVKLFNDVVICDRKERQL